MSDRVLLFMSVKESKESKRLIGILLFAGRQFGGGGG